MIRTVLTITALFFLCGQTVFSQCTLVCHNSIQVPLDNMGQATIYPPMLFTSSNGCSNNFNITVLDEDGNQHGQLLDASLIDQQLMATLLHPASGNSCEVTVTLIDNQPPVIDCSNDTVFIWCNTPLNAIAHPSVTDNVSVPANIAMSYSDVDADLDCNATVNNIPVTAYLQRTWTATDEHGNTTLCVQHIYMKKAVLSQVEFPKHRDGVQLPVLECGTQDPLNFNITGYPMIDSVWMDNTLSCDLVVSFNDQAIPICGGGRKILRTWSIFDLCTDDFRIFTQIIRVQDTTPPAITCPANMTFTTYPSVCTAQVYLPQANATDACSGATVTPSWQYGTGNGPFNNVPVGTHTVTYTATDGCNNSKTCTITVTVKDEVKPVALCENQVQANLLADGTTLIFAETFNNGSYDNCTISQLEVSYGGQPFDTFVSFDCSNIGTQIPVTLRVVDAGGLSSTCVSQAIVKDQVQPEIICPGPVTIGCGQDFNNSALTGLPFATDNCSVASTTVSNAINLNNCGNGTVTRTWMAKDQSNNAATCQQVVTIGDITPITVTFPTDVLTYECEPNTDVSVMGDVVVTGKDCEQLQITHTDYFFYTAEPACFKLIRNWAVIDWCSYSPNAPNGAGFWESTQVIEVRDSVAPVLSCPASFTVGIDGFNCSKQVNVPLPTIDDCSDQLTITNNSQFATNSNGAASGVYPKGTHSVTYTVSDGCGNTSTCATTVTVVDAQAPSPICNNGVAVTIQQNGFVTITPSMINNGSNDNCSPTSMLIMQVSPNTFDCQNLGTKVVTLTVTDQAGNSAFCQTNVVVQDNFNVCSNGSNGSTATVAGKLATLNGTPASGKLVGLSGAISNAVQTNVDGTFAFANLPLGQDYTLTPSYNTKPLNGVTTFDIVLIRRHVLNIQLLDNPYNIIAADVNRSGSVTTLDMVELQKLILTITSQFPNNTPSWRFVPVSHVFPTPTNPFAYAFPESLSLDDIVGNYWTADFVSIKVGDVNGSANPTQFGEDDTEERGNYDNSLIFKLKDIELVAGQEYAIPFVAHPEQALAGFQFTLDFEETMLDFVGIAESASLKANNFGLPKVLGTSAITLSWVNEAGLAAPEFTIKFKAKKDVLLSNALTINSLQTTAEAYAGDFEASNEAFESWGVGLEFEQPNTTTAQQPILLRNYPNPFGGKTTIEFQLPETAQASFRLHDQLGRVVRVWTASYEEGLHQLPLDLSDQPNGLYLLEMQVGKEQPQVIKMINDK
ncbi:MAG: HYR domain-containing protein [Saprospiraceae bacterium]|nr:HYR domain-containing protein [Saprospiraceae bacterium]